MPHTFNFFINCKYHSLYLHFFLKLRLLVSILMNIHVDSLKKKPEIAVSLLLNLEKLNFQYIFKLFLNIANLVSYDDECSKHW